MYIKFRKSIFTLLALTVMAGFSSISGAGVDKLTAEYSATPMGIDVKAPRFGWQMSSAPGERNLIQTAYHIVVKDPAGNITWDSGKTPGGNSAGIVYAGSPLKPSTRYTWDVTVWDQKSKTSTASSWFETGLMDGSLRAWEGAQWIGGGDEDLVLYSPYLVIFNAEFTVAIEPGSMRAAFIFGANDSRLLDKNKNIFQLENKINESYIKIELDISGVSESDSGMAKINVYRAGYSPSDTPGRPFSTFKVKKEFINPENKNLGHTIGFSGVFGQVSLTLDGSDSFIHVSPAEAALAQDAGSRPGFMRRQGGASVNLNPAGSGGNYIPFGMLCDIGFSAGPGQKASFSGVKVRNNRLPNALLFSEDLSEREYSGIYAGIASGQASGLKISGGKYIIDGGEQGVIITADPSRNSAPMLRTGFSTGDRTVRDARLYITARGIYEAFINGKRVSDDYYNPGLTQYNITHLYQTYDVTSLLGKGPNTIGVMLGEGWWSGLLSFGSIWNHFGDRQSLLAKLVITYSDGTRSVVTTNDSDWKYFSGGPLIYGSLDMGEAYDATREDETAGWTEAGYNDSKWKKAVAVPLKGTSFEGTTTERDGTVTSFAYDKLTLTGQVGNNAGIYRVISAESVKEVRKGVFVYNMGQNIVGVPRITMAGGKAGNIVTLRFSEMLYPDLEESGNNVGMIMTENYRAALSQDIYIMKDGSQVYQPRFTSHGFQYIEISGIDRPLPLEAVQSVAISSVRALTASYETSNPKVNQLWSNLVWSNIDNFLTIPTDCPQRNERMGWSGDINVFAHSATYISNAGQFLRRHLIAMRDVQSAAGRFTDVAPVGGGFGGVLWGSAGIVVPWQASQQYGDIDLLREHYPAMVKYMDYLETTIDPETGLTRDGQLGDWLGPQNNQLGSAYLTTAYHAYDLHIMSEAAALLGKPGESEKYKIRYEQRKEFFNKTFVNAGKKTVGLIGGGRGFGPQPAPAPEFRLADVQTAYAVGLGMNLFNEENRPFMIRNLKEAVERENPDDEGVMRPGYSLMTGFIGTAWISKALSDNGLDELAYRLLQNDKYPSWLYSIDQGATTIWERLNGYTVENGFGGNNSMNSFNHYSFGAVGQWMMAYSLGIQRDEPAFRRFILQPRPDPTGGMIWAGGYYDSMYGRISSSWKKENGKLTYEATVPANTTVTLYLPASSLKDIRESGKPVKKVKGLKFLRFENDRAVFELGSGDWAFVVEE
jgi:alpha-L-rhamnosidase